MQTVLIWNNCNSIIIPDQGTAIPRSFIMQKIAFATRKLDPEGPSKHMQNYRKANIKIFSQPMEKTIKKGTEFHSQLDLVDHPGGQLKNILVKN